MTANIISFLTGGEMGEISLSKESLKDLIKEAYKAGWHGSLEMQEGYAEEAVGRFPTTPFDYSTVNIVASSNPGTLTVHGATTMSLTTNPWSFRS